MCTADHEVLHSQKNEAAWKQQHSPQHCFSKHLACCNSSVVKWLMQHFLMTTFISPSLFPHLIYPGYILLIQHVSFPGDLKGI